MVGFAMNQNDKIEFFIKYISDHPTMSGNAIYNEFKGSEYSMRKKDFFKVYRSTKGIEKPSSETRFRSTPKKYRKRIETEIKKEREISRQPPREEHYDPFFESLEYMVFHRMGRKPDNLRDLEQKMFQYRFRQGLWPTRDQLEVAWVYLRSKGLTER